MVVMTVVAVAMEIEELASAGDDVDGGCAMVVLVAAVVVGSGWRCLVSDVCHFDDSHSRPLDIEEVASAGDDVDGGCAMVVLVAAVVVGSGALMSMVRVFKTRLRSRGVKLLGNIDIEFKIVNEYSVRVNKVGRLGGYGDKVEMVVMTVVAVAMEIEELASAGDDVDGGCAMVVLVAAVVVGSGWRCLVSDVCHFDDSHSRPLDVYSHNFKVIDAPIDAAVVAAEEGGDEVEMVVMTMVDVAMEIEEVTSAGDDVDGGCVVVVLVAAVVDPLLNHNDNNPDNGDEDLQRVRDIEEISIP
ncbi:hypothetical protein Tco_0064622 [Tanacetum coccineum]